MMEGSAGDSAQGNHPSGLTDLKMPKMDGGAPGSGKTIRPETEVILITGYGTVDTAVTAMKDGAFVISRNPSSRRRSSSWCARQWKSCPWSWKTACSGED
jgi:DNA-binding NtrC family response regulator